MINVGLAFLASHDVEDADWRVGVVAIEMDMAGRLLRLEVHDSVE